VSDAVNDAHETLLDEIERLLAASDAGGSPLARIEDVLTAGYAHALALEAEGWRLERRIGELAAGLGDGNGDVPAEELACLARRKTRADGDLGRLRSVLATLSARASALRAA
jgi:hypothetical protein